MIPLRLLLVLYGCRYEFLDAKATASIA